ncbi:hypothetical protein [Tissierella pigra]|uniref:Uncharacterized protein n=1 Tax=Tissierella pigra TaxID=2607614 RepID=A0A6N7Y1Q3_9FIRM|nr:hypothetical protein [Tissierella pigra]MSU01940.1 hypothetical protein [Tissierella pigra]
MARGGISFEGIGFRGVTFKAGAGIKALVSAANRDVVVGVPVVVSGAQTVDLGTDGDTVFGFIDVYEDDGHVTVQVDGFRTDVPIGAIAPTVGKIAAVDGTGKIKDSGTTAKLRNPIVVEVDTIAKVATVFLG